jgi:hypothetical protein
MAGLPTGRPPGTEVSDQGDEMGDEPPPPPGNRSCRDGGLDRSWGAVGRAREVSIVAHEPPRKTREARPISTRSGSISLSGSPYRLRHHSQTLPLRSYNSRALFWPDGYMPTAVVPPTLSPSPVFALACIKFRPPGVNPLLHRLIRPAGRHLPLIFMGQGDGVLLHVAGQRPGRQPAVMQLPGQPAAKSQRLVPAHILAGMVGVGPSRFAKLPLFVRYPLPPIRVVPILRLQEALELGVGDGVTRQAKRPINFAGRIFSVLLPLSSPIVYLPAGISALQTMSGSVARQPDQQPVRRRRFLL